MKILFSTFFLLFSMAVCGQNTWKPIATKYLDMVQGDNAWLMEMESELLLDSMINQVIAEFNPKRQNRYLLHMLANLSIQRNNGDYNQYLESALLAHRSDSISKALLLMEYSRYTLFLEDSPFYKDLLDSASRILATQQYPDVHLNIHLLKEYANLYPYDDAATEPISQLNEAIQICKDSLGKDNSLYLNLLQDLSNLYDRNGKVEKHYQLEKEIADLNLNSLGADQLDFSAFSFKQPDLSTIPLSRIRSAYLLMAQMYEQTSDSYFNSRMSAKLFELASKYQKAPQYERIADFSLTIGQRYTTIEEYHRAIGYLKTAVKNYDKVITQPMGFGNKKEVSELLLAKAYYGVGRYEDALEIFNKYDSIYERLKDYRKPLVHNLILTNSQLGNTEAVKNYMQLFLEMKGQFVDDADPVLLRKYGRINEAFADADGAYRFYKLAYDEYWNLAGFREMAGEEEAAQEALDDAEYGVETIYNEDIIVEIETDNTIFAQYNRNSIPIEEPYTELLKDLANSAYLSGRFDECAEFIEKYINKFYTALHFEREDAYYADIQVGSDLNEIYRLKEHLFPIYDLFQNVILKAPPVSDSIQRRRQKLAYNHILDSKSNIQFEFRHMMKQITESDDPSIKKTFKEYTNLREELSKEMLDGGENIDNLKSKLSNLRLSLSSASAAFKPLDKQFVFWKDVRNTLNKKEALIEIRKVIEPVSGQVQYFAFIISQASQYPKMILIPNGDLLESNHINSYKNSIKFKVTESKSYEAFWKPIAPFLSGIKKIYFAPSGVYHQLNVNTLYNGESEKYVIDEYQVIQVISGKQLTQNTRKNGKIKKATLLGRPSYSIDALLLNTDETTGKNTLERALTRDQIVNGNIADLPGTETEVRNIEGILKKKKIDTDLFLGNRSTEANLKSSAGQLIHIATHGFWFEERADSQADAMFQSGLLLAGAKNYSLNSNGLNDGILTAYEIQGMSLEDTQLAVMSACETGLGKITVGEGVFGLQRAFIIAGVDQLLMSLWKVDDEATQQLFTVFYKEWIQKGKEVSEAFAAAQKAIRKKYKHPYYWGAFVLVD